MKALFRHLWAMFMVNIWKRASRKLRRIILFHFGLITFRINYGRNRKPIICIISGFSDVSMTHNTNIMRLWTPEHFKRNPKQILNHYQKVLFGNTLFGNHISATCWNRRAQKIMKIRLAISWKSWILDQYLPPKQDLFLENLEQGINIFQKTQNGNLVIWNQYLPKKHEIDIW